MVERMESPAPRGSGFLVSHRYCEPSSAGAAIQDDEGYLAAESPRRACGLLAKTTAPLSLRAHARLRHCHAPPLCHCREGGNPWMDEAPSNSYGSPVKWGMTWIIDATRPPASLRAHSVRAAIQNDEGYLTARIAASACGLLAKTTTTQRGDDASLRTTPLERMAASAAHVS